LFVVGLYGMLKTYVERLTSADSVSSGLCFVFSRDGIAQRKASLLLYSNSHEMGLVSIGLASWTKVYLTFIEPRVARTVQWSFG